jgi:hypothetical protein
VYLAGKITSALGRYIYLCLTVLLFLLLLLLLDHPCLPIQLKPRTVHASQEVVKSGRQRSSSAKGDPFGAAVPREQVLKNRGIDASAMDASIERKANVLHFTSEQEAEIEAVRLALTKAEKMLLDANENELPEETFRVQAEAKRRELNDLMAKFANVSVAAAPGGAQSERQFPERSSEHRGGGGGGRHQDRDDDAAFVSFSSVRRRREGGTGTGTHQTSQWSQN